MLEDKKARLIIKIEGGLVAGVYTDDEREYDISVLDKDCYCCDDDIAESEALEEEIEQKRMREVRFGE